MKRTLPADAPAVQTATSRRILDNRRNTRQRIILTDVGRPVFRPIEGPKDDLPWLVEWGLRSEWGDLAHLDRRLAQIGRASTPGRGRPSRSCPSLVRHVPLSARRSVCQRRQTRPSGHRGRFSVPRSCSRGPRGRLPGRRARSAGRCRRGPDDRLQACRAWLPGHRARSAGRCRRGPDDRLRACLAWLPGRRVRSAGRCRDGLGSVAGHRRSRPSPRARGLQAARRWHCGR
jgi:hypothetical protein